MNRKQILGVLCLAMMAAQVWGSETPASPESKSPDANATAAPSASGGSVSTTAATPEDLKQLRERIAQQEEEIKRLQQSVEQQRALLEKAIQNMPAPAPAPVNTVSVANNTSSPSGAPVQLVPAANVARPRWGSGAGQHPETQPASPLSVSIGNTTFTPLGFIDATLYGRSTNLGSGIGTNFAAAPYGNATTDHLSEFNFSTQNSRIGFRVDSTFLGAKVLGYFEADFLGNAANSVYVTSNADTFRMRNVFVDVQKNGFEILGGQDWGMEVPNRRGISPLPSDIFYTQNMDTNYQVGLPWTRQSQFRFIAHPNEDLAFGVSFENPQQYVGGNGGLSATAVTFPAASALSTGTLAGTQLNNAGNSYNTPNVMPDIIFKAAYDGHVRNDQIMHIEAVGMVREFKIAFPLGTPASYQTSSATAGAGEVNANLEVVKNFRIIANTFFGSGNGRYLLGTAPDLIVRANGSISPVHTYSTLDGFEFTHKNTTYSAYYGGEYIGRDVAIDTNGSFIGYGFPRSGLNDNRTIQEGTLGIIQTLWKNSNYGALSLITQYSYLFRDPWSVLGTSATSPNLPKNAHSNMYWVDLRYTLP